MLVLSSIANADVVKDYIFVETCLHVTHIKQKVVFSSEKMVIASRNSWIIWNVVLIISRSDKSSRCIFTQNQCTSKGFPGQQN